jgi:three-Cys-motif partner protein
MKRRIKNKDATHLSLKIALYERFLYGYLPQLASRSFIKRINLFDAFGSAGLDRLGSQGSPFILFQALRKQRQHQLKKKLSLKPFTLSMLTLKDGAISSLAYQLLLQENALSSTCKIELWQLSMQESIKKLSLQLQQQPAGEKNLLFLDPLGIPHFSFSNLKPLLSRKAELILYLPLSALWQLHRKPEKTDASPELLLLKQQLDSLFPDGHPYWTEGLSPADFMTYLKEGLQLGEPLFTALEPAGPELPEAAIMAISNDAFTMEKLLQAMQLLRPDTAIPAGQQLPIFMQDHDSQTPEMHVSEETAYIKTLLSAECSNQNLYAAALQAGHLPASLQQGLQLLLEKGLLEIRDEKGKPLTALPANCIGYTAYKAAKAVCYFSLKD